LIATSTSSGSNAALVVPIAAEDPAPVRVVAEERRLDQVAAGDRAADLDRVVLVGRAGTVDRDVLRGPLGVGEQLPARSAQRR
jgi:hypothetical protein